MSRFSKALSLVVALGLSVSVFSGCNGKTETKVTQSTSAISETSTSNFNPSGFPIVNTPITLKGMGSRNPNHADWDKIEMFVEYEKMTGIKIEWEAVPDQGYLERKNVRLASNDYPDFFFRGMLTDAELTQWGNEGIFIPLNDLIANYAPNLSGIMTSDPGIAKAITSPSGKIYSLPQIQGNAPMLPFYNFINKKWMDNLGLKEPKTTEEYYQVLKAFRERDPNGNGQKDEIPLSDFTVQPSGEWVIAHIVSAWGLGNKGAVAKMSNIDLGPDGKVRFYPVDPLYKEALQFLNKLWTEELLDKEMFTANAAQLLAKAEADTLGAFMLGVSPNSYVGKAVNGFDAINPLTASPDIKPTWVSYNSPVAATGTFAITKSNKYPEATMRWVDYFYSMEGHFLLEQGPKDKYYTVNEANKTWEWTEFVTKNPTGLTALQAQGTFSPWPGGSLPTAFPQGWFREAFLKCSGYYEKTKAFLPDEAWRFSYTDQETKDLALMKEIGDYVKEMNVKFVTGSAPFTEWDSYVDKVKKMNLSKYLDIQTAAYERWKASK